ncbi:Fic family protein [Candidatus Woesearchaeota archaeon]|nr:Fic family protein [Candidatus Woesearchaeota archaeon]
MYLEKRKIKDKVKYYLVYSYREKDKVKKIRKYLGINLSGEELEKEKKTAEQEIKQEIDKLNTEIFDFALSKKQIERLNRYDKKLKIHHLEGWDWKKFTEQFTYNTNAIEGSSIQLDELPAIMHKKSADTFEEIETRGVAKAIGFIRETDEELSLQLIKKLHKMCFQGSKHFAGNFRNVEVVIKDRKGKIIHEGVPVPKLLDALYDLIDWYKKNRKKFKPLVLAAIIHNQFEHIHPFQDGNGRVGRLLLNYILIKNKYPPINISLENRKEYYNSLQEYHKHQILVPTLKFLIKQYNKTLNQVTTKK